MKNLHFDLQNSLKQYRQSICGIFNIYIYVWFSLQN